MKQPEAKFKKKLTDGFEEATEKDGWWTYVIPHMGMKSGIPDLFFAWRGRTLWIEAKVGHNWLDLSQQHTISCMLRSRQRVAMLAYSKETVEENHYYDQLENPQIRFWSLDNLPKKQFWKALLGMGAYHEVPPKLKEWKDR